MKKIKTTIALAGLMTMGAVALSQPALAAPQNTNATVEVNPGTLTYTAPLTMEFNPVTVNGSVLSTIEKTPATMTVTDYRGTSTDGWALQAKVAAFQNNGIALSMSPVASTNTTKVTAGAADTTVGATAVNIMKVTGGTTGNIATSEFVTTFKPTAKLTIPATVRSGDYNAAITWDIITGPTV
ncbi:hypothetical protein [Enterococcus faecalis]|uniref:hypothetical protein n=1 Tax=Enterococcus faecalis TaxID=1351 RepID=UPI002FBDD2C2